MMWVSTRALPTRRPCKLAVAALLCAAAGFAARAQTSEQVRLIAERPTVAPGASFTLAVDLQTRPGWHTYWLNPGDAGLAPTLRWRLSEGVRLTRVQYPVPDRFEEEGIVSLGYSDRVWLLADFETDATVKEAGRVEVGLAVDWMVCREVCMPVKGDAAVSVAVAAEASPLAADERAAEFKRWRDRLPKPTEGWTVQAQVERRGLRLQIQPPADAAPAVAAWGGAQFYAIRRGALELQEKQRWRRKGDGWESLLRVGPEPIKAGEVVEGVLVLQAPAGGRAPAPLAWNVKAIVTGSR